jgi:hypothetical protein
MRWATHTASSQNAICYMTAYRCAHLSADTSVKGQAQPGRQRHVHTCSEDQKQGELLYNFSDISLSSNITCASFCSSQCCASSLKFWQALRPPSSIRHTLYTHRLTEDYLFDRLCFCTRTDLHGGDCYSKGKALTSTHVMPADSYFNTSLLSDLRADPPHPL